MMVALPATGAPPSFMPMRTRPLALLAVALVPFCGMLALGRRLGVARESPYDVDFVPRASAVRWLSLGHPTLAADLYWLRTVQYMGDPRADQRGWGKLFPLVDLVTDLDPGHGYAYQVAGNILGGAGRVAESNRILEKGIDRVPNRYILPFHRAVNAYLYQGDYAEAGRWFEKAAATPGAPPHLRENVVAFYVKGNRADAAVAFLEHLRASATDPESRKAIEKQLARARLEQVAWTIDEALERYRARFGIGPLDLGRLVASGLLTTLPLDPLGGDWFIGEDGRVRSSVLPERFGRPTSEEERRRGVNILGRQIRGVGVP